MLHKLSILVTICAVAFAASAASTVYWASIYLSEYEKDVSPSTENATYYSAYLCTQAAAQSLGGTTVKALTDALSSDYTAWDAKFTEAGVTPLTSCEYGSGQYGFTGYFVSSVSADQLAVVVYQNGKDAAVRVFGSDSSTAYTEGVVFDDTEAKGTVGSWTSASIPEPTSALLMLLGLAGLALKRRA